MKQGKKHFIIAGICLAIFLLAGAACTVYLRSGGETLVVYFTRVGNTDFSTDVDAVSSASLNKKLNGELEGNSEIIAEKLWQFTGGDLFAIETSEKYPQDYEDTVNRARSELNEDARPKLIADVEKMEQYERIILVYPVWWGTVPTPVFTFLEQYDFSGKEIVPVATHKGSFLGSSAEDIQKAAPESRVKAGIPIAGGSVRFIVWLPVLLLIGIWLIIGGDFIKKAKQNVGIKTGIAVQLAGAALFIFCIVRILI